MIRAKNKKQGKWSDECWNDLYEINWRKVIKYKHFLLSAGSKHLIAETSVSQFRVGHKGFAHPPPESLFHDKKYVILACGHDFSEDACIKISSTYPQSNSWYLALYGLNLWETMEHQKMKSVAIL